MSEIDYESDEAGAAFFRCLLDGLGEEAIRKMQWMINHGCEDRFFPNLPWGESPNPESAKKIMASCIGYMRRHKPVLPWHEPPINL